MAVFRGQCQPSARGGEVEANLQCFNATAQGRNLIPSVLLANGRSGCHYLESLENSNIFLRHMPCYFVGSSHNAKFECQEEPGGGAGYVVFTEGLGVSQVGG